MENLSPNPSKIIQPNYHRQSAENHRFVPTEKPRIVIEQRANPPTKIAGSVGFKPVATLKLPEKNVFVRPVKNTHQRAVSPAVVSQQGKLQVSKDRSIEISDQLHSQIQAKVKTSVKNLIPPKSPEATTTAKTYVTSANLSLPQTAAIQPVNTATKTENKVETQTRNENLKKQLEELNKTLFEQIKKKIAEEITRQIQTKNQPQVKTTKAPESKPELSTPNQLSTKTKIEPPLQQAQTQPPGKLTPDTTREHLRTLIETRPNLVENVKVETKPLPKIIPLETATTSVKIEPPKPREQSLPAKPPTSKSEPSIDEYKQHISKLEEEITLLNKEVNYMDRTIADLEKERDLQELSAIEKKIDVDRAMLKAVADWRFTLNNLINSHTMALRYLKQKTDWLETQVERLSGHPSKHLKEHHKPKPIEIKMSKLPTGPNLIPTDLRVNEITQTKDKIPMGKTLDLGAKLHVAEVNQDKESQKPQPSIDLGANINVSSVTQQPAARPENSPITIQANLVTKEVSKEEAAKTTGPTVIKEVQTTSFEAVKKMVQEALNKERSNIKPSEETVKTLVDKTLENKDLVGKATPEEIQEIVDQTIKSQESLIQQVIQKELPNLKPAETAVKEIVDKTLAETPLHATASTESVKEVLNQTLKAEPSLIKPSVEEIKGLIKEELKVQEPTGIPQEKPSRDELKSLVKEVIAEGGVVAKPSEITVNLSKEPTTTQPTSLQPPSETQVAPTINVTLSQADIEKQILDAAAKEESEKAAQDEAKRESARKKAEEEALKKLAETKAVQAKTMTTVATSETSNQSQTTVSEEVLKNLFGKLKTNLTTVDPDALQKLPNEKRTEMIQKLQNLEKQNEVSRQFDDIKAAAERRRINTELQAMLSTTISKVDSSQTPKGETIVQPTAQKIESLKIEEKKQQTPEEKAKVIAEIKDLERQAQARKAAEAMRPVVKAQPAYGKMLPNTPTVANVINGIVKDSKGLLLPTVVIIVKDHNGDPVRALKTNKIGQFALSTAVPNGTYTLELEKEGYDFDIIEVDVNGTIMQPIEVKAR